MFIFYLPNKQHARQPSTFAFTFAGLDVKRARTLTQSETMRVVADWKAKTTMHRARTQIRYDTTSASSLNGLELPKCIIKPFWSRNNIKITHQLTLGRPLVFNLLLT
jgi:hypothetical protein